MKYRKKPIEVEATQWFKNGDHPRDNSQPYRPMEEGETLDDVLSEGQVVRYFRHPEVEGSRSCEKCGQQMHYHGWIDTLEGGHIVCPNDWIITGIKGEYYPCKPDIFEATYELVDED
jgi:hypothetical protein